MIKYVNIKFDRELDPSKRIGTPSHPKPSKKNMEDQVKRPAGVTPKWLKIVLSAWSANLCVAKGSHTLEVKLGETWRCNVLGEGVTGKVIWVEPYERIKEA